MYFHFWDHKEVIQPGDKVKVVWDTKDATAKAWENVTVERISKLSETEILVFFKEFPMTPANLKRVTKHE